MRSLLDDYQKNSKDFEDLGIKVPKFDKSKIENTEENVPVWIHFGGGNLFRSFHALIGQSLINQGIMKSGIVVAEMYDDAVVNDVYHPYKNMFLSVTMNSDGSFDQELVASVADSIFFNRDNLVGWNKLIKYFEQPELQLITFSITEKGYAIKDMNGNLLPSTLKDISGGPDYATTNMGALTYLLYQRFQAGSKPLALVSTDNFSENGKKLEDAVRVIAQGWVDNGFVGQTFLDYLFNSKKISFPWSMIDRITPNPSEKVAKLLHDEGFEDTEIVHTKKHTNIAPFGNTEETHYLVIEDDFPNGRPDLSKAGVILTNRETVNNVDQMKVTALLNPLHTGLAIYGTLLRISSISLELKDNDLKKLITTLGYDEDLPVVIDPKVINPKEFLDQLIQKRLPNPNIPDTPQRIATDTSQKVGIRYGVTIKNYLSSNELSVDTLEAIPLIIAGWFRYLLAVDDDGKELELSSDPLLENLQNSLNGIELGEKDIDIVKNKVWPILANKEIFGVDLTTTVLSEKILHRFMQLLSGPGAVRQTLHAFAIER